MAPQRKGHRSEKPSFRELHGKRGYDLLRDGKTRTEIAMALDVDWSIATKWPKHLAWKGYESWRDVKQEDRPEKLTGEQKKKVKEILDSGPGKYDYSTDL